MSDLVHHRFRQAATRHATRTAIVDGGRALSYAELSQLVAEVSEELARYGVGPGDRLLVVMPRSARYVATILAGLDRGATCLPVNDTEPAARVARVAETGGATHVVDADGVQRLGGARQPALAGLAFAFATSGSTGVPKLVAVPHSAVIAGIDWARDELSLGPDDRHLFRTAPGFVTVLRQVIWPLTTGGCTTVLPPGAESDLGLVARTLAADAITVSTFIPSALRVVLPLLAPGSCPQLRHLLCGAEALPQDLREEAFRRLDATVHNLYASTEAPMAMHHRCSPTDTGTAPLGRAVAGARVLVVGDHGDVAKPGELGEILVGGAPVSAGYLRAGVLDTSNFVEDQWHGGDPLVRTGDRARVDEDGVTLRYAGREDDFVKIRGFRVAPGELEVALARHSAVAEASVVALGGPEGSSAALAAFVVAPTTSETELREHLSREVPSYLQPDRLLFLDAMPRLANGKIDRAGLVAAAAAWRPAVAEPRDDLEAAILEVWRELLGRDDFGIHDTFRDLGGDSLIAVELAFRLDELFDTELPSEIFSVAATVAQLADACRAIPVTLAGSAAPASRGAGAAT